MEGPHRDVRCQGWPNWRRDLKEPDGWPVQSSLTVQTLDAVAVSGVAARARAAIDAVPDAGCDSCGGDPDRNRRDAVCGGGRLGGRGFQ
ncbi:hypothetical protein SPHINGOT1_80255 [Sphingomonas sp. T1]|nr:hypothetical protein SPHINGOT1_80255 [Sphingomonas sp. T1]